MCLTISLSLLYYTIMKDVKKDLSRPYCKVYCYDIDGKRYYGYTGQSIENRHRQHYQNAIGYVDNQKFDKFHKAWRGSKDQKKIRPKVLAKNLNMIEALLMESYCIFLDQTNKSGLNTTPGGESGDLHVKYLAKPEEVKLIWGKDAYRFYDIMQVEMRDITVERPTLIITPGQRKWIKVCDIFKFSSEMTELFLKAPDRLKYKIVKARRNANTAKSKTKGKKFWTKYWSAIQEIRTLGI